MGKQMTVKQMDAKLVSAIKQANEINKILWKLFDAADDESGIATPMASDMRYAVTQINGAIHTMSCWLETETYNQLESDGVIA